MRQLLLVPLLVLASCAAPRVIPDRPLRPDAAEREFSAEAVVTSSKGRTAEKLHVGNGLLRTESQPKEGETLIVVVASEGPTSIAMVPHVRTAIRFERFALVSLTAEHFVAGPDGDPCAPPEKGWTCERIGDQRVGPFDAVEWAITDKRGAAASVSRVWVDKATQVVVKYIIEGDKPLTTELTSLTMGHQPDAIFAIPDGYMVAVGKHGQ